MAKKTAAKSYSRMLAELQEIIDWFESDDVDLDEALKKYQQANHLIDKLENYLKTAENKVRKIAGKQP